DAIVQIGRNKGLNIIGYEPGLRNIDDGNHPNTNWSVGATHVKNGGYALEIHFDSYGEYGFGSGLIPAISSKLNLVDESLANNFGRYPLFFRGGLGGPKRGIRILEIGKLEGNLERKLRNQKSREKVLNQISNRIVNAIILGIKNSNTENI
ncbi:MAG: N-acetylmuramoyl-L-alanine amidase, partial [Prochlorococcaceae cyanobacterium ETNP1_MAG_9]|nr:N-acetylmuramoyl-L-alanine amidase [Prochlorococcaceae cyanobacterium ETNP1_MAG_9]